MRERRQVIGGRARTVSLALWRGFAWHAEGSPRHGFELTATAILDGERALVAAVRGT
jgi:hypothetical protein